jgi:hypothetical protein
VASLQGQGLAVELGAGWEGRIRRSNVVGASGIAAAGDGATTHAVLHAANFPLPGERGDFGSGAVELMGPDHAMIMLVEYHRAAASTALFANEGAPRALGPAAFSPDALQRTISGQAGTQVFFNARGRAFCLYVVIGSARDANRLVPMVNSVLSKISID